MAHLFTVLVPVKRLRLAKSRLAPVDPAGPTRAELMRAFVADVVAAAARSPLVAEILVVASEPEVLPPSARWLDDEGAPGLNQALGTAAARVARPDRGVAALCGDLPCLRSEDLTLALAATGSGRAFVTDRAGSGTTLLAAAPRVDLGPAFGSGSAAAHRASGAAPVTAEVTSLRLDVDDAGDLRAARSVGLGPTTRSLLGA